MKTYVVGGAVRDALLGRSVSDRDHVVVGATPQEMQRLGYKPVGRDFPVFLHPQTHEEYALARTERKTARGYHGFEFYAAPDVTLEQDLARRDLTINAMARAEDGTLIDPYGGEDDLRAGILRHVSPAFAEDPVRILRVARFAARFGFVIATETQALMRSMTEAGEVDALVPERVWQELSRGLVEHEPSRMFAVLRECGALERVAPELAALYDEASWDELLTTMDEASEQGLSLDARWAAVTRRLDPYAADALAQRLKVPTSCRDLSLLAARHANTIADAAELDAEALLELLNAVDAWRKPERCDELCRVALIGEPGAEATLRRLRRAELAAAEVDAGAIARTVQGGEAIREAVAAARLAAIREAISVSQTGKS
jgi:tRNA nucleotidyltransferase (CCA-adding enzyme)